MTLEDGFELIRRLAPTCHALVALTQTKEQKDEGVTNLTVIDLEDGSIFFAEQPISEWRELLGGKSVPDE